MMQIVDCTDDCTIDTSQFLRRERMSVYLRREVDFNCIKTKESVFNREINY